MLELAKLASLKASEADNTQIATQVGGGVSSGLALAGATGGIVTAVGVVGSVVAGVFTFGIGMVVGLAATAGAAELSKDSQAMSKNATAFGNEVIELQANIEKSVTALRRLKERGTQPDMKEGMITVTCRTLDQLGRSAKRLHENVETCREIFKDLETQLKKIDIEN